MKNKFFGVLTVIIAFTLTACPEPEPDPQCECIVKVHPYGSPCTCPAAGTSACDCTEEPPTHTHDAGTWITTQQPTCTEAGTKELRCTVDNFVLDTDTIPALGHDWGAWEETTAPTTTTEGEATRTCKNDATHKETQPIDKLPPPPCTCEPGTKQEPGEPCCEDPACPCPIATPTETDFQVNFNLDLFGNNVPCEVLIQDARVDCGSATLQDKGIVNVIQQAITGAYGATDDVMEQIAFTNVFNGVNGTVTIIVNNPVNFYKLKATDSNTIYFHINYLTNNTDIQAQITKAVNAMNPTSPSVPIEITKAVVRDAVRLASVGTSGQHLKQTARG